MLRRQDAIKLLRLEKGGKILEQAIKRREGAKVEIKRTRHCKKWRFMVLRELLVVSTLTLHPTVYSKFRSEVKGAVQVAWSRLRAAAGGLTCTWN